ncbi:MAG: DUF1501 domain-containing protein [Planctomycetota bacterium]
MVFANRTGGSWGSDGRGPAEATGSRQHRRRSGPEIGHHALAFRRTKPVGHVWDPKPRGSAGNPRTLLLHGDVDSRRSILRAFAAQAKLADKMSILRSVDCSASNHTPITMQAGNAQARRTDDGKDGQGYPSMGSIVAKFRGANRPGIPGFIGLADSWVRTSGAGHMGTTYKPVQGSAFQGDLRLAKGIDVPRLADHDRLRQQFDRLQRTLDSSDLMAGVDRYNQMAMDMLVSNQTRQAFEIHREPDRIPGSVRQRESWRESTIGATARRSGCLFCFGERRIRAGFATITATKSNGAALRKGSLPCCLRWTRVMRVDSRFGRTGTLGLDVDSHAWRVGRSPS